MAKPTATSATTTQNQPLNLSTDDLQFRLRDRDPFVTACPDWCTLRHTVEGHDEDRYHASDVYRQAFRSLHAEYVSEGPENSSYTLGHTEAYLIHRMLHADPMLHFNLNGTSAGIDVTLDEAEQFARLLLFMVEAAR